MSVTQFPQSDHDARIQGSGSNSVCGVPEQASRKASFHHVATIILSAIGFAGLAIGLSHLLNGNGWLAILLAFCIQGLAVSAIHSYKQARNAGSSFNPFRGGRSLALYGLLIILIVCNSYSWWYRLLRANEAAGETFTAQKQIILTKLSRVEARYKAISEGFSGLAAAASARAREEKENGNTCRIASPKGPGPIQQFRTRDSQQFRDYATQIATKVREISLRGEVVRTRALGQHGEIRVTEAAINQTAEQINTGLIGNPLLPGVVQFIDARLGAADSIEYFGRIVKCDDEQRSVQLMTLKAAAKAIMTETPLSPAKLLDPDSTYDNTMVAANRIAALIESANPFSGKTLADLDPAVRDAKLPGGIKVYLPPDYWPLVIALMIEGLLFFVVPAPQRDTGKVVFVNAIMRRDIPFRDTRTLVWLMWLQVSVPAAENDADESHGEGNKPLNLPPKFVRLRPYIHSYHGHQFLVIPHAPEVALVHDYADALVLKGHAKTLVEDSLTIETLPSLVWSQRVSELLSRPSASVTGEQLAAQAQVHVRILEVSREFYAWLIGKIVELDESDLKPDPSRNRAMM
jgi:hypothetical protein